MANTPYVVTVPLARTEIGPALDVGQSGDTVGFYGVAPVARQSGGSAVDTTAAVVLTTVGGNVAGFTTTNQANALVAEVNVLRAALVAAGLLS